VTHDELKGRVADLAIGALDGAEARLVEAHLAGCPECAAELRSLTGTAALLRALPPIAAPSAGEASLVDGARRAAARMAEARAPARRVPRWLLGLALGGAGAAAALLVSLQVGKAPASRFDEGRGALEGSGAPASVVAAPTAAPPAATAPAAPAAPVRAAPPEAAPVASPAREPEEAKARRPEPAGGPGGAAPAKPSAVPPPPRSAIVRAAADAESAPATAQAAPRRRAAAAEIGLGEAPQAAAPSPPDGAATAADRATDAVAEAAAPAAFDAERDAVRGSANLAKRAAPALAAAKATARQEAAPEGAEDRAAASSAGVGAAPPPEVRRTPGCVGETRSTLWRDAEGRVARREREGRLGGQAYRILETFDATGRLVAARLETGGRAVTADRAGVAEGRLAGLVPGLLVAGDAAAAEAAPPRCGP